MARHRNVRHRRARDTVLVVVTAAGMSGALVLGHATNNTVMNALVELTNTVIGAGGRGDALGERVQQKLSATVQPAGYGYEGVNYPATIDLAGSRDIGVPVMHLALTSRSSETYLVVAGYSEGSLVAERVRRDLQERPLGPGTPSAEQLSFVMIASPFAPNGGIYSRFPGLGVPFIIDGMTPSLPTRYDTTYHALEYDTFADFPAYFNPLALLNSALAFRYGHPDAYYDTIDPSTTPNIQKEVVNSAGGTDTYILYRNPHLPLLGPIRELASIMQLTSFAEPILGAIEPLLRLAIDMAYTDRTYANVDVHTPFSLFTPPDRIIEALLGVPDALRQGLTNLLSGGQTALAAQTLAADTPSIAAAGTPSTVPALHDSDFTAAPPTEVTEAEPDAAQNDIEQEPPEEDTPDTELAAPTDPTDGLHPKLTSDGNKVTPIGAVDAPASSIGASPVATPTTETETTETETGASPDPEPDAEPEAPEPDSESQNDDDHADAAA